MNLGGVLLVAWIFLAWLTHVIVCIASSKWVFLLAGAILHVRSISPDSNNGSMQATSHAHKTSPGSNGASKLVISPTKPTSPGWTAGSIIWLERCGHWQPSRPPGLRGSLH